MAEDLSNPQLRIEMIMQTRSRLSSAVPQIPIIRPGEFCHAETFLDNLPYVVVNIIAKISASEPSPYQSEYCSRRSESELLQAVRLNSSIALESAIALGSVAINYVQEDDPNRGIIISMFGRTLRRRWQVLKEDKDLDDAIYYFQKTVEIEPAEEPNRALHFDDLGCALWERYTRHRDEADFQASKVAFEIAAEFPHSGKALFLSNLGRLYKDKALFSDNKKALMEKSLIIHLEAISCVTEEFRASVRYLHRNLATTYLALYSIDGINPIDKIDASVKDKVQASGHRWMFLYELGVIFSDRFVTSAQQADANKAVTFLRAALAESPENVTIIATLAKTLEHKGISLRSQQAYTEAYRLSEKVMNMTSEHSVDFLSRLLSTSLIANGLFDISGDLKDIENAISLTQRALASSLLGDSRRWKFQQVLGIQLGYRFQVTQKASDLEEAVSSLKAAINTVAEGLTDFDKAGNLREYGKVLLSRFKVHKNPDDFYGAVQSFKASIELSGPNHIAVVSTINDLANAMAIQFEKTGQLEDIHQAIDYHLEALAALERFPLIKSKKPSYYVGLGNAFYLKYEMWNQAADLNQSITYYEAAVKDTDLSDARLGTRIGSLSKALLQKCRFSQDRKLLESAQVQLRSFLARMPPPSPHDIAYLQNILGSSYLQEYDQSNNDISFFDKAAESFQAALDSGSTHPLDIHPPLLNLMRTLTGKYSKTHSDDDLKKASQQLGKIQTFLKTPNTRQTRSLFDTLGRFASLVYDRKKLPQFGRLGMVYYGKIASDESAFSGERLWACLQCSRLIYEVNQAPANARDVIVQAIQLLPEAILMGPNRGDQLRAAKDLVAFPSLLISFSLAAGDSPADLLRLYEQSRSFIWNRLLDTKTDLSTLHEKHKDLATRFEHLRVTLSRASPQIVVTDSSATHRVRQHDLHNEYNEVLRLIRQEEGFERFLLLDEPSNILNYAGQGPIVILNATRYRGDAITITSEGISSIFLPEFIVSNCVKNGAQLQEALLILTSNPERASLLFNLALKWLWDAAASPVLVKLGLTGLNMNDQELPRIWWVVNGWISVFPIHAAGDYARAKETGERCTVMDRAISSYIPTLRALDYARKSAGDLSSVEKAHPNTAVLIKMPTTPHDRDLTNVSREVALVQEILHSFQVTSLEQPTRQDVMSLLEQASLAHFACHGIADSNDPSLSKLKLHDWEKKPLDVRFLLHSSFRRLRLVYLSACETALNKAAQLQEESIHLSSAFHMAGVPYTVGSMWNVEDGMSVQIASDFYSYLAGERDFDFGKSAEALHFAGLKARNDGVDALLWGAFIHSGA